MFGLGLKEVIILTAIFILLFSPKMITTLGRGIGEAVRSIRGVFSVAEKKDNGL